MKKDTWKLRALCREAVQRFWFGRMDINEVLDIYCIAPDEPCREAIAKTLKKTKRDFINGFSFFTRESTDKEIISTMEKMHARCMIED